MMTFKSINVLITVNDNSVCDNNEGFSNIFPLHTPHFSMAGLAGCAESVREACVAGITSGRLRRIQYA